jgi:hypothetical protein
MLRKLLLSSIAGLTVSMLTLPAQAAPASNATSLRTATDRSSSVEQVHYYRRHHRYFRHYYYQTPGYFYGHRHHHRYWRHY